MKGGTNEMPYQHERILSGIMGKGEIVGAGENWQYAPRFVVFTEIQLTFTAFQGVSYGEGVFPENYPITIGMSRQKFDEFDIDIDIDIDKNGFLTLETVRQCIELLNKTRVRSERDDARYWDDDKGCSDTQGCVSPPPSVTKARESVRFPTCQVWSFVDPSPQSRQPSCRDPESLMMM
jgi:hypothetical protein